MQFSDNLVLLLCLTKVIEYILFSFDGFGNFIKLQSISLKCLFTCFKSIKGFNTEHIDGLYIYRYAAWNGLTILDPSIYRNKYDGQDMFTNLFRRIPLSINEGTFMSIFPNDNITILHNILGEKIIMQFLKNMI